MATLFPSFKNAINDGLYKRHLIDSQEGHADPE